MARQFESWSPMSNFAPTPHLSASPPPSARLNQPSLSPRSAWANSPWGAEDNPYRNRPRLFKCSIRRALLVTAVALAATLSAIHAFSAGGIRDARVNVQSTLQCIQKPKPPLRPPPFDRSLVINFKEPQDSYKVQLKHEVRYVTTMSYGGHANQFISIYNILYTGKLLKRVVIIPTLAALHFDGDPLPMSAFFDIERFIAESGIAAVLLSDLKELNMTHPPPKERVSCWSVHENVTPGGGNQNDGSFRFHSIDVDYWSLPKKGARTEGSSLIFEDVLAWDLDHDRQRAWIKKVKAELIPQQRYSQGLPKEKNMMPGFNRFALPPNDQLLCLDVALFIGSNIPPDAYPQDPPAEPRRSYENEGWIQAGQFLHFNAEVEGLVDYYLAALFKVPTMADVPPFITVHIRRSDFKDERGLTSLEAYTKAVERVRVKLQERIDEPDSWRGAGKEHAVYFPGVSAADYAVVVTTDEGPESPFVQDLLALDWKVLDHTAMRTEELLGGWYPTIIDQAILARGRGFVGTEWSTYSYLGGLRVKYWNGGVEEWTPSL